jgi:hypothetical protein
MRTHDHTVMNLSVNVHTATERQLNKKKAHHAAEQTPS